ncbi:hypothetical protein CAXC1_300021 [Candidatus Xenohaliotis californiensis]|uniref:Uncharacterized protein n=1 Tax=Candidatus Xenohaliotis californiensis TaxID=84677 RepID=A0ABM9N8B0_9RICK|nr:hypothetical protein CAXC1_300021 [Candidatus Xenohaliotis californiensis]
MKTDLNSKLEEILLKGSEKPNLFIVYTWCTKDPDKLQPDDFPIHEVKLTGEQEFTSQLSNILQTAKMAEENNMIVVLNVEKDSMPEANFHNLLEVLYNTPVKIELCNPEKKFNPNLGDLGSHVDITKARTCMDLHERFGSPVMSIDVDMALDPRLFLPWFEGHKDIPFNLIEHPKRGRPYPPYIENSLIFYNYKDDDKAKDCVCNTYDAMLEMHDNVLNCTYSIQERNFARYHKQKYNKPEHSYIKDEDMTPEKIGSIPKQSFIPWDITNANRENNAKTWSDDTWSDDSTAKTKFAKKEQCLELVKQYLTPKGMLTTNSISSKAQHDEIQK